MPFFLHRVVGQETQLQRVQGEILLIGRGTGAQPRFPQDGSVDLEHALIRQDEKGYLLVDQGSVTGTYLNGQAIERARLSDDDRIEIGGHQLRVQIETPWPAASASCRTSRASSTGSARWRRSWSSSWWAR